jgi:hypothetical protein
MKLSREQSSARLGMVPSGQSTVTLCESATELEESHDLTSKRLERESLMRAEFPDIVIQDAKCPERDAV